MNQNSNVIRILVDGYSLTHYWQELESGKPRHSEIVRNRLIHVLRNFQAAHGTPLTLVFDAGLVSDDKRPLKSDVDSRDFEILYTRTGQTADEVIERVTHRLSEFGAVVAVTNDRAEQETVRAMGGYPVSCEEFIRKIKFTLDEQSKMLREHNQKEARGFNNQIKRKSKKSNR